MSKLDACEMLKLAMEMEETLQVCYELLGTATSWPGQPVPKFLLEFAAEEDEHYRTFHKMLEELGPENLDPYYPADPAMRDYIHTLLRAVTPSPQAVEEMIRQQKLTLPEAYDMVIATERATIVFYTGMLPSLDKPEDIRTLQQIISEEKKHEEDLLARRATVVSAA